MIERNIQSRFVNKHDVEKNWNKAINFIPKKGEIIIYDVDENYDYPRLKVGDGITVVSALPFNGGVAKWSDLTEKPFEAEDFANLQADVETLQADVEAAQTDIVALKVDVSTNKTDISDLKNQANTNKSNISALNSNVSSLQSKVSTNTSNITTLRSDLNTLSSKVVQPDWNQEDDTKFDYIKNKPQVTSDYIILKDQVNGYNYIIMMVDGNLISRLPAFNIRIVSLARTSYIEGEIIDKEDVVAEVVYQDGTTNTLTDFVCEPALDGNATIHYTEFGKTFTAQYAVEMTSVEEALIDFTYTKNADGTYTITKWNGTLNGEPSTELVVPNSALIKL